jgi:protein O-mannosyl-transferase
MKRANTLKLSFFTKPSVFNNRLAILGILLPILILVFFPTFFNSFQLAWDDTWQVLENPLVHETGWESILFHFTHFWQVQYSPVNSLFYLLINSVFGMNASAFHATCLVIHLINSWLVLSISLSFISRLLPSLETSKIQGYAFFTALLFAIHPLQVESVAWISASKIILYGLFTLFAIWSYFRYIQSRKPIWLIITALVYFLGFASKEQAIILPLNLLLIDFAMGRFTGITRSQFLSSRVMVEKIPFFLLALAFLYFTWVNSPGTIQQEAGYPIYQRVVFAFYSLVEYVFRFLAPAKLYFFHPYPMSPGDVLPLYYWGYLLLAGIIGYFVWEQHQKGNSIVLFGFLFFLINLILVLHIIPLPRPVITADRYMYLSVIGLAWILVGMGQTFIKSTKPKNQTVILLGALIWLILLGIQTNLRTAEWKDSETTKSNVTELLNKQKEKEEIMSPFNLIEHE